MIIAGEGRSGASQIIPRSLWAVQLEGPTDDLRGLSGSVEVVVGGGDDYRITSRQH